MYITFQVGLGNTVTETIKASDTPLSELEDRLQDFPEKQKAVAYCRGPHCVLAFDAVARRPAGRVNS